MTAPFIPAKPFGNVSPSYAPARKAQDALLMFDCDPPRAGPSTDAMRAELAAAARAEQEADPVFCMEKAAWLERLADEYDAAGKTFQRDDSWAEAARLRSVALSIMAPVVPARKAA